MKPSRQERRFLSGALAAGTLFVAGSPELGAAQSRQPEQAAEQQKLVSETFEIARTERGVMLGDVKQKKVEFGLQKTPATETTITVVFDRDQDSRTTADRATWSGSIVQFDQGGGGVTTPQVNGHMAMQDNPYFVRGAPRWLAGGMDLSLQIDKFNAQEATRLWAFDQLQRGIDHSSLDGTSTEQLYLDQVSTYRSNLKKRFPGIPDQYTQPVQ